MNVTQNLKSDTSMQQRAELDIAKRSITGAFIYLPVWFAIIIPAKLYITEPETSFVGTILLVVLALTRIGVIKKFGYIYSKSPAHWKISFYPLVILPALIWGVFCAITVESPAFHSISLATLIATAGFAGGGSTSMAPNRFLSNATILSLLLPSGLIFFLFHSEQNLSVGIVFVLYGLGLYSICKPQRKEYWKSLKNSSIIKQYTKQLEHINTLDGLTGLKNRKYFDHALEKAVQHAQNEQADLALLIIDIDHFKSVNDEHGHPAGDACLKKLSKILPKIAKRDSDTISRFGGEEFAIILPGINVIHATIIAEKIRSTVESVGSIDPTGNIKFTISIGIACKKITHNDTNIAFLEAADKALYKAKAEGRNQIQIWDKTLNQR